MIYTCSSTNKTIELSESDIQLLLTISGLGIVTGNQLEMLYSVAARKHKKPSQAMLKSWQGKGAPLNRVDLSKHKVGSGNKVGYAVSYPFRRWAVSKGYAGKELLEVEPVAVNDHNIQAVEVIVQAVYSACFG